MSVIKHAVIAAAGLGSRLGHGLPKCLVEIAGRKLIDRQLELLAEFEDVRIVVGYMEHAVIEAVSRFNRNVIFVRNPSFRTTTTQDSYALGAKGLTGPCLFMDADIVFERQSFKNFMDYARNRDVTIGVTDTKTDDAVFALTRVKPASDELEIVSFSREQSAPYEWANIVVTDADTFHQGRGAVFETLQELLPASAKPIISYEVDTEQDLARAKVFLGK